MKKNKGITLIALVVTIIIMLILAVVTVNVVLDGESGLMGYNQRAETEKKKAEEERYMK